MLLWVLNLALGGSEAAAPSPPDFTITLDGVAAQALTIDGVAAGALTLDGVAAQSITLDSNP